MKKFLAIALIAFCMGVCKKDSVEITPLSSLNLVNATVNAVSVKANFTSIPGNVNYFNLITATTAYSANTAYGVLANQNVGLVVEIIYPFCRVAPKFSLM